VVAAALAGWALAAGPAGGASMPSCSVTRGPENGRLGADCPQEPHNLSSGSSCQALCDDGYDLQGVMVCDNGNLRLPVCIPAGCNVSEALELVDNVADLGSCPEQLESGEECEPLCGPNYDASGNFSCLLGNLTTMECTSHWMPVPCPAGFEFEDGMDALNVHNRSVASAVCTPCPSAEYKPEVGPGPCKKCPAGANSNIGSHFLADCSCNATFFAQFEAETFALESCVPCPNNSQVVSGSGTSLEDCTCQTGFMREPKDDSLSLLVCRPPYNCNLTAFFNYANLTGPQQHQLKMGTCAAYEAGQFVPSGKNCHLLCDTGTGPQLGTDIFGAVDLELMCE
ncbi:unnamed protein product, partial [Polarella glacialis]